MFNIVGKRGMNFPLPESKKEKSIFLSQYH
jgi:hypothetical protein